MEQVQDPRVFNRPALLTRMADDSELVDEIIALFLEDCSNMFNALKRAVASQNSGEIESAAHALKGALLNICADNAARMARELEILGRDCDLDGSQRLLVRFEADLGLLVKHISA
jgi:two-component system sensor histidine kinase/response regulator